MLRLSQLPTLTSVSSQEQQKRAEWVRLWFYTQMERAHRRLLLAVAEKKEGATPACYEHYGATMKIVLSLHDEASWWDRSNQRVGYDLSRIWKCVMKMSTIILQGTTYCTYPIAFHDIVAVLQETNKVTQYLGVTCSACYTAMALPVDGYQGRIKYYCLDCTPTRSLPQTSSMKQLAKVL